jgi:hypothetical protein
MRSSMSGIDKEHGPPVAAAAIVVWDRVWGVIDRFTSDVRAVLGSHLREGSIGAIRLRCDGSGRAGALIIGRTRLRLECSLRVHQATAGEALLHEVFGADARIVRIFVFRELPPAPPRLESILAAEPASGRWVATEPEMGPASLGDDEALRCFLWSLLADRAS